MAKVRAAVLAAGRGVRMGGQQPKALIPVDGQEPLLHYTLKGLRAAGVDDLVVVTGFLAGDVSEFVTKHWGTDGVQFVFNARWASFGNFHSVRMALDQSPGRDLLVVNSDVVVRPDVLTRVVQTPGDLVLAVEKRLRLDEEDMRVRVDGDRVRRVSKYLKLSLSDGEFCGVSMLRPDAAARYMQIATDVQWSGETTLYYEDIYDRILGEVDARAADVKEGEYAEIDEPGDVSAAVKVIEAHAQAWADAP